jgi:hypothetical protein
MNRFGQLNAKCACSLSSYVKENSTNILNFVIFRPWAVPGTTIQEFDGIELGVTVLTDDIYLTPDTEVAEFGTVAIVELLDACLLAFERVGVVQRVFSALVVLE